MSSLRSTGYQGSRKRISDPYAGLTGAARRQVVTAVRSDAMAAAARRVARRFALRGVA